MNKGCSSALEITEYLLPNVLYTQSRAISSLEVYRNHPAPTEKK
jgi:hypothetical protein